MENKFEGGKIGSWETGQKGTVDSGRWYGPDLGDGHECGEGGHIGDIFEGMPEKICWWVAYV